MNSAQTHRARKSAPKVVYSSAMLEIKRITKTYGKLSAINGVSFRADYGETVGLLGPNGAGKTTTVSIIAGLLKPDSGEVLVENKHWCFLNLAWLFQ
jgi:ABC-type multidrug transport system ATPase subunit